MTHTYTQMKMVYVVKLLIIKLMYSWKDYNLELISDAYCIFNFVEKKGKFIIRPTELLLFKSINFSVLSHFRLYFLLYYKIKASLNELFVNTNERKKKKHTQNF